MNKNLKTNVKKHIPKDWLCELRIFYRLAKETFNDIRRTGWVNVIIITTMAAILMIFYFFFFKRAWKCSGNICLLKK